MPNEPGFWWYRSKNGRKNIAEVVFPGSYVLVIGQTQIYDLDEFEWLGKVEEPK